MARVLAVHRYFHPDVPPYASMLRAIVQRWSQDGHQVNVIAGQPSYRESTSVKFPRISIEGNVRIRRLRLPRESGKSAVVRLANAARLSAAVAWRLLTTRYDYVMVSTAPPVALAYVTGIVAKLCGTRLIYHCMDLHPEIGRLSGEFANPRVYNVLLRMDSATMQRAWAIVVLSDDMARAVHQRSMDISARVLVRNNFALPQEEDEGVSRAKTEQRATEVWASLTLPQSAFTVLFAGNIGRFQGLGDVLEALASTHANTPIHLVLMGDGSTVDELRSQAQELGIASRVHFVDLQSVGVARHIMGFADSGLVSLQPEIIKYAYPSKTATYAEEGLVLVAIVEPDSSLAEEVRTVGAGVVAGPGDTSGLASLLGTLADSDPEKLRQMSVASRTWADKEFSESVALDWWSALIQEDA